MLIIAAISSRELNIRSNRKILQTINQQKTINIPLEDKYSNILKILLSNNKEAIRDLIVNSEDDQLNKNMQFLSMQSVPVRRNAFKRFFQCLLDVHLDQPTAQIWLKANIDFDLCRKIISDWEYQGRFDSSFQIRIIKSYLQQIFSMYLTTHTQDCLGAIKG